MVVVVVVVAGAGVGGNLHCSPKAIWPDGHMQIPVSSSHFDPPEQISPSSQLSNGFEKTFIAGVVGIGMGMQCPETATYCGGQRH